MNFSSGMKNLKFLQDSDIMVTITPLDADNPEGTGCPNDFTFTIRRTVRSGTTLPQIVALTVNYAVTGSGGNPAVATDFPGGVFPSGTFTFNAMEGPIISGAITKTLTIYAEPDAIIEPDEGFRVTLSNPFALGGSGGNMGNTAFLGSPSFADGTIRNDDPFSIGSIICLLDTVITSTNLLPPIDTCQGMGAINVHLSARDSVSAADSTCLDQKIIYRIYEALDGSRCIQKITVRDTVPPALICANDTTVDCVPPPQILGFISGTDNSGGTVLITFLKDSVSAIDSVCVNQKVIYRTYLGVDECMNDTICIQKITVRDTISPVLICPNDTIVECTNLVPVPDNTAVTATDNCGGMVMISFIKDSVSAMDSTCVNQKVIYRTYRGADECNNDTICIQKITIRDTVAPTIICGNPITVACREDAPVPDPNSINSSMDNCTNTGLAPIQFFRAVLSGTNEDIPNLSPGTGQATVIVDNLANTMRVIVLFDGLVAPNTAAHIHAPTTVAFSGTAGVATTTPTFTGFPSATTSGTYDQTYDMTLPGSYRAGYITANGGTIASAFDSLRTAMVAGKSYLNIHSTMYPAGEIRGFLFPSPTIAWVKDSISTADSICLNKLTIYRIYSATDECNNTAYCIQEIIVKDTIGPAIPSPVLPDTLYCPIIAFVSDIPSEATDNCGGQFTVSFTNFAKDSNCAGDYKLMYLFVSTDTCGNTSMLLDSIRILDTLPPVLTAPDTIRFECDNAPLPYANLDSLIAYGGFAKDSCCLDSASFELASEVSLVSQGSLIITRSYVIHDCCGLTDTFAQILIAPPCLLDLALKKVINAPTPFFASPGGIVPYTITVYNQFAVPADSIKVIDYLPSVGSSITDPDWTNNGDGTACITLSRANGRLPASGLLEGDSVVLNFTVQLGLDIPTAGAINAAEIVSALDTFHNVLDDLDSTPNDDPNDETGTVDDEIDDDGTLDEDDNDIAGFFILRAPVCNDQLNVSLGANCEKCFTADDLLEGITVPDEFYTIQLYDAAGNKIPGNCVNEKYIGYTLIYKVILNIPQFQNSCWGLVTIEDKAPPLLNCADDTIACYELPTLPLLAENSDDCYDGKVELISDQWFEYNCDSVFLGYVIRTIQGTDRWGNFRRCTSTLFIERTELDSVVCPVLVDLPCEIRTQIGGGKTLKTPIVVDLTKVTPTYLLSLQKKTWDFTDGSKDWILNPNVQVVPKIEGQNIWPGAGGICKINSLYRDTKLDICGAGFKIYREWIITDWCTLEERTCVQYINVEDKIAPQIIGSLAPFVYNASAHDCVASVTIPALIAGTNYRDCNLVVQTYSIQYDEPGHPGKIVVLTGTLPSTKLTLPVGEYKVVITLTDQCQNRTLTSRLIYIYDITPPTPVCDEFTQVTVDPVSCWAKVKAKDLDNGSRDNCCDVLHFAAAHMDSITYWRKYWADTLEARCGKAAFWNNKIFYDEQIKRWINAYVFKDEIGFSECGTSQVVLRVYEACGVPVYDPHLWPCSEHQWFWYNTNQQFRIEHNWNYFHSTGPKDCNYRYTINCIEDHQDRLRGLCEFAEGYPTPGGLCFAQYLGAIESLLSACDNDLHFGAPANSSEANPPGNYCSARLYSDCMVTVLVDDKQAPVVAELEDIIVYCDRAPGYADGPDCDGGDEYLIWPGLLKDSKGVTHGYYGGSDFLGIHFDNDHQSAEACGYDYTHHWAPIYCRSWLYVDSFDSAGHIDPKLYFEKLVMFDKGRPTRALLASEFSITDNCRLDTSTLTVQDEGSLNGCTDGWIQRTWTIKDKCGNAVTAKQKVIVKHRSDFEAIFPEDKVVECDFINSTDPDDTGRPIISDDECEQVGVQYKDQIFTIEEDACYKIVRTWTLIDWCVYNPNAPFHYPDVIVNDSLRADTARRSCVFRNLKDNNDGYMQYIQIIKVIDLVAPNITSKDTTICIFAEDCKSDLVRIPFAGTDNCTAPSEITYRVEVDLNVSDAVLLNRTYVKSSIDIKTASNQTEFVYSPSIASKHVVHVIGSDNCGNEDTSSYRFELRDCKKPTPYCYNGIATVIMPSTGLLTVWAADLDAGSYDNCTDSSKLKFSFSADVNNSNRVFSCADIPDGISRTIPVDIWVTDEAGNQDHCSTYILLQDNSGNICPDVAGISVTIGGSIKTENNEPVEHVGVNIYGGATQLNYQTGIKGTYHFEGLPSKANYSIKSKRNDQPMNGVSTLDLVLIQKHILGVELLDSPYKILAADIDNDKQITAIDLVELRKLILATYEGLPNNESWRFIPKSTTFADKQNPWNINEIMIVKDVTTDHKSEDFVGIKVGDVNATAAPHSLMGVEVRGNETGLIFEVDDQVIKSGDIVRVAFRSPNFRGVSGFQGTLAAVSSEQRATSSLSDVELIAGSLDMKRQNIGLRYAQEGMITMSWNTNAKAGVDIDDQQVLFTLVFKAQENGKVSEVLRIGSQHTVADSYQGKGELGNLSIRFVQNGHEIVAKSELYQNYPNPFDQRTVIGINLASQGRGTLKIYDATGRTIRAIEKDWTKGYHEVWFDRKEIGSTGVLYYRFESGFFTASKKMVLIK